MHEKYIGKTLALPKDVAERVTTMQSELEQRLGFKPSMAETVAVAVTAWLKAEMK